ncbi:hypothetical protein [Streptomyces sp. DASNCL29]|uniref:hypothetical protein n=1 Tax=Streptomyces sp. DASNCL29 TaxID=2583819 RepID=UPI00110FCBE7|nr:hypothetical protein [Streptomyces sp. DASNCL29]TMU98055.1 hypothetical protein FGK60_09470 [Streptomyces sp. DASNCL29]
MTASPTPAEQAALKVAHAVPLESKNPGYSLIDQIVFALGSAQLLQSPETGVELDHLRKDRDAFRNQRNAVFKTNERLLAEVQQEQEARLLTENDVRTLTRERDGLRTRVAELEAAVQAPGSAQWLAGYGFAREQMAEAESGAPSQVIPVVDDVPIPAVLTEMDGPSLANNASARAATGGMRRLLHPLDPGVRS